MPALRAADQFQSMRDHYLAGLAVTMWLVGLPGLICDSIQPAPFLITATHALFITVTCSTLCLALVSRALASSSSSSTELYLYTRSVSRWIYVAVYGLALVRLGLYLCLPIHARSLDDFQFYIGWSVVPLWVIRTLILAIPSRSDQGRPTAIRKIAAPIAWLTAQPSPPADSSPCPPPHGCWRPANTTRAPWRSAGRRRSRNGSSAP